MVGIELGRRIGKKIRSPRAARRDAELSAKIDGWAARHRLVTMLAATVFFALAAWWLAATRDGATTVEIIFWELGLVPAGLITTWLALARIRRRSGS